MTRLRSSKLRPDELARAAVRVKAADALLDQPVYHPAQFVLVDATVVEKGTRLGVRMPLITGRKKLRVGADERHLQRE
jgi:hypothetical protein